MNNPLDLFAWNVRSERKRQHLTQKQLAEKLGKSERTVKNRTKVLQEKGYIKRLGGKRNGRWELLVELQR